MIEERIPLIVPPGFHRNGTPYQARDRWYDGNLVRFLDGTIGAVGGWRRMDDGTGTPIVALTGKPRSIYAYRDSLNGLRLLIGTHSKAYNITQGVLSDITPSGFTPGLQDGATVIGTSPTAYGAGAYGAGPYGGGFYSDADFSDPNTWSFDNFGDWTLAMYNGDGTLYWTPDGTTALEPVTTPAFTEAAPTNNYSFVVTPERFVVLLGASGDRRSVQWSDQEDVGVWTPTVSNQAGQIGLATDGVLIAGRRTRRATLLFTSTDTWTMQYVGGDFIFTFDQVGTQCGLIGPNAVATIGSRAYWMGRNNFYVYDGWVQTLPSDVRDYVFSDINLVQAHKIACASNGDFDEVTWFYCSQTALENDRYVTFNYRENHWVTGQLDRGAILDRGAAVYPVWVDTGGLVWEHEIGPYRSTTPYIVSGPIMLGKGDRVLRIQRVIPDEKTSGSFEFEMAAFFEPGDQLQPVAWSGPYPAARENDVRLTGRFLKLRFSELQDGWRLGQVQLGVRPQGRR